MTTSKKATATKGTREYTAGAMRAAGQMADAMNVEVKCDVFFYHAICVGMAQIIDRETAAPELLVAVERAQTLIVDILSQLDGVHKMHAKNVLQTLEDAAVKARDGKGGRL